MLVDEPTTSKNRFFLYAYWEFTMCSNILLHVVSIIKALHITVVYPQIHKRTHSGENPMNIINVIKVFDFHSPIKIMKEFILKNNQHYECYLCGNFFAYQITFFIL